jgi:predicted alpha/beta superfamily hydrolase
MQRITNIVVFHENAPPYGRTSYLIVPLKSQNHHPMRLRYFLSACLLFSLLSLSAQPKNDTAAKAIEIGKTYQIHSDILEEDRPLHIYLPKGYEEGEKAYPVIYLLDGGGNFHHTTASVNFLANQGRIPEMIVVGIPNTGHRTRDLTPPTTARKDEFPTAGGADNMLRFITGEVMPHLTENYRATDYKLLIGHSFGGLFAAHTLLHHPGIFDSYIAISPSLWWDDQDLVLNQSDTFFKEQDKLKGHWYMTMGNEDGTMVGGAWKLSALLEEKGPQGLKWHFNRMEKETHGTIPFRSTYKGLEFIFSDYDLNRKMDDFRTGRLSLAEYEEKISSQFGVVPEWGQGRILNVAERLFNNVGPESALPFAEKATKLYPKSERAWRQLGEYQKNAGQEKAAITSLQKALEIDPTSLPTKVALKDLGVDVGEDVPTYEMTDKQLRAYTGAYDLSIGLTFNLELEAGKLWILAPETAKESIVPLEKDVFFVSSKNARLTFNWEDGKVTGMTIVTPGPTFTGKKIK